MNVAAPRTAPALQLVPAASVSEEGQETIRELEQALCGSFRLSARERQVLRGLVSGASDEAIARALGLRISAAHKHMHRVFARTQTADRGALLKLGFRLAARRRIFTPSRMAA